MDLTDDEVEDAHHQVQRWIRGEHGRELSTPLPSKLSTVTAAGLCNVSVDDSCQSLGTIIDRNIANVSAVDDVRPSCSGMTRKSKPVARRRVCSGSDFDTDFDDEFDIETDVIAAGMGREIPDDDELEQPVQNIIDSVERAIDEAADSLLGVSANFTWEQDFESFRGVPEQFSGPTPGPLMDYDTPYDAFRDIWTRDIMELIALETNRYAQQTIDSMKADETLKDQSRLRQWKDTDADEIMILFAVYMYMGIDPRTSQNEYWKSCGFLTLTLFKNLMTYSRFLLLSKFLHFVDNSDVNQDYLHNAEIGLSAKLAKIAPVISHLNSKFSSLYNCRREISIDESLTLFKGRLSWIQAIRSKAARFGIKSYELCESRTGYLQKFQIYTGKNSQSDDNVAPSVELGGKSTKLVLELLKGLENRGHSVTMDNFYNCPALARYLKSLGFDCLGTLRVNRKNVPEDIAKVPKNVPKGTIVARHCGDVSVLAWKDSKVVTMISTFHNDDTYVGSKAGRTLVKPVSVRDYNNTMGGVDLKDQKLSMYLLERKRCVKWYMKIFKRLLNVSVHNAFILHLESLKRRDKLRMTHREFRYALAESVVKHHRPALLQISEPEGKEMRLRKDITHVPTHLGNKNRGLCVIHQRLDRKLVPSKCVTCGVFLCFEGCWEEWHSKSELSGREVRGRKKKRTLE